MPSGESSPNSEPVHILVRVWLADRPGALGQVASRIGAVRGDIIAVDVLEQGEGVAIDEFALLLADRELIPILVREIEEVDGASVEEVREVDQFPDARLDALRSAARLCDAQSTDQVLHLLVTGVRAEFSAEWVAVVRDRTVLAASGDALPAVGVLEALALGTTASEAVAGGIAGPADLAVGTMQHVHATLLAERKGRPFRRIERAQLIALVVVADRVAKMVGP